MKALEFNEMTITSRTEVKKATDGRGYFTAQISPGFGLRNAARNFWQQFKRDALGMPTNILQWERVTPEQADAYIESGKSFLAAKVTETVEPYTIGEGESAREVDTYSTILFKDEDAVKVFASAGHRILDKSTGELLGAERKPKTPILASKEAKEVAPEGEKRNKKETAPVQQ